MASVTTRANGSRLVIFTGGDKQRKTITLGQVPAKIAEQICTRVEYILAAKLSGVAVDPDTARWLGSIDDTLADKLARVDLIEPRAPKAAAETLGAFLDGYLASRTDVKPRTQDNFQQAKRWLVEYFGRDKPLPAITCGDADEWRLWLAKQGRQGKPLGKNTIRRHCGRARQYFRAAKRKKLIAENPFDEMKDTSVKANRERDYFVTLEEAQKVLDACPDAQWRLLFALSRFGGLRCPSEHLALTWADVDWERNRMTVRSPKTEHHAGKESRIVPIFPELLPHLEAAFNEAPDGTKHVITIGHIRSDPHANPRSRMSWIIRRAGLEPWPKLFHNLRASRQTELAATFPQHVVCEWIGNSPKVASEHYLRVTDADYDKAATTQTEGNESAAQCAARGGKKAQRNAHTDTAVPSGTLLQIVQKALEKDGLEHVSATLCKAVQSYSVPPA